MASFREMTKRPGFMAAQYGHLDPKEWPTGGDIVDVTSALKQNTPLVNALNRQIQSKRKATQAWIKEHHSGATAAFLTRPFKWRELPEEMQKRAAEWMATVINKVYGEGYPLPNKYPDFNLHGIQEGSLLPYIGLKVPAEFHNGRLYGEPELLLHPELTPVATSAIVLGDNGFAELGRTGRDPDFSDGNGGGFEGATLSLERTYDWARNRHRLLESIHTMTSDIRAAEAHDHSPSSGPVQDVILQKLGMKIRIAAPLYNVNGLEPFLSVIQPRDVEKWKEVNAHKTIYTTPGDHVPFLRALWKHQLGFEPYIEIVEATENSYPLAIPTPHGRHVYGSLNVLDTEGDEPISAEERTNTLPLLEATHGLEGESPVVVVQIEAESPRSAATQAVLLAEGYTICGIEPAYDAEYIDTKNGEQLNGDYHAHRYTSPAYIYMAKLGKLVTRGEIPLAKAYYPHQDHRGNIIHSTDMQRILYEIDAKIRQRSGLA